MKEGTIIVFYQPMWIDLIAIEVPPEQREAYERRKRDNAFSPRHLYESATSYQYPPRTGPRPFRSATCEEKRALRASGYFLQIHEHCAMMVDASGTLIEVPS